MPKETKKQDSKKQASKKQDTKNKKHFMKDFKAELKRVIWPTPKQLLNNTIAVITIVLVTAAIVFVLDLAFESINKYGIGKLKEMVQNTSTETTNTVVVENSNSTENEVSTDTNNIENETTSESNNQENAE